jgi:hypothetical protein
MTEDRWVRRWSWMLLTLTACSPRTLAVEENGPDHSQACGADAHACPWPEECINGACEGYRPPDPTGSPPPNDDDDDGPDDEGGEDGGEGCGNFLCVDEGQPSCDPGTQDCPEGEKCTGYVMTPGYCCVDANKCVPVIGDQQFGEFCMRDLENDDCTAGLFCMPWTTSGDVGPGVCLPFCDINDPGSCADSGLPESDCIPYSENSLPICEGDCNPVEQDCAAGTCYIYGRATSACTQPYVDAKATGEVCEGVMDCIEGLSCAAATTLAECNGDYCCTPFCTCDPEQPYGIDSSECSTPGEQCSCYFGGFAPPQYETVGTCSVPQ